MVNAITKPYKNLETFPKNPDKLSAEDFKRIKCKDWYVRFRYWDEHTGKWILKVNKSGLNSSELSATERIAQLKAKKKALKHKLEVEGWNPLTDTDPVAATNEKTEIEKLQEMTLIQAIDFAVKAKSDDLGAQNKT